MPQVSEGVPEEARLKTRLMSLIRLDAPAEEIAQARADYRRAVADRKRSEIDAYEAQAEAELAAAGHDGA